MSVLLAHANTRVERSASVLKFQRTGPSENPAFTRELLLDGRPAYTLGTACDTCPLLFERWENANASVSPAAVSDRLRAGLAALEHNVISAVGEVLPAGAYVASLLRLTPTLVRPGTSEDYFVHEQVDLWGVDPYWNLPHHPRTEYYRTGVTPLGADRAVYEFVVPMFPHNWLRPGTTRTYADRLSVGEQPTALALSVLEVRQPATWSGTPEVTQHYCWVHYLLDGHHKMHAAAEGERPITLLSFLSTEESIATAGEIDSMLQTLIGPAAQLRAEADVRPGT